MEDPTLFQKLKYLKKKKKKKKNNKNKKKNTKKKKKKKKIKKKKKKKQLRNTCTISTVIITHPRNSKSKPEAINTTNSTKK